MVPAVYTPQKPIVGPGCPRRASSSTSVDVVTTPGPQPRPGPAGPDIDQLRADFDDLLVDTADGHAGEGPQGSVSDHQVAALDAAHDLLAQALTALDSPR